ncbi:hypothetical protein E1287_13775 [Actinomadura sp. KC06]|uniref:hypothetical protein n=1 Tax=Actinomadura sp. KC06 TaxID=2530369 RepID=UPI00104837A7|nr:hypothetical protein [Actinomadura sp. KC06]TDD35542.1 hypothetical protein E1287_13775 [Actinomadura sp. KC06]
MSLFAGAKPNPLNNTAHILMQAALETARQGLLAIGTPNVDRLALMVVLLTGHEGQDGHPWAGVRTDEEHFSASLLKVAAMYAAFDLRSSADQLVAPAGLTSWPDIEAALRAEFDPEIDAHTPVLISDPGLSPKLRPQDRHRKPDYGAVLKPGTGSVFVVDFTPGQLSAFRDMIVGQHNPGATTTIHGLGYPYLNGKLADDGFFESSNNKGVWLAGDYTNETNWPSARIDSVNDGLVAQATTVEHFARMLTLLFDDRLIGPTSNAEMRSLMQQAGAWFHHDGLIPGPMIWPRDGRFIATASKVGLGPLKSGKQTFSEGLVVHDTSRALDFLVVWQNVHDTLGPGQVPFRRTFEPVAQLIEATISAFVPL